MPRATPCEWAQEELWLNQTWKCISGLWRLSTTCTWLVKTLHNMYLACEDSPQRVPGFSTCTWLVKTLHLHFAWFSSCFLGFFCTLTLFIAFSFSVSRTVGCVQYSTPQNTYVAEKQLRCTWRMSFWACMWVQVVSANLTFLSVTDMYLHTYACTLRE